MRRSETFSSAADDQPAVDVHVLQGERELARDNRTLGHFRLEGIRPGPRGQPQIEVAFDIDADGILTVSARHKETSKEQNITTAGSTQLSKQDIDRMVADPQAHGAGDRQRREEVEARNAADAIAYQVVRALRRRGRTGERHLPSARAPARPARDPDSRGRGLARRAASAAGPALCRVRPARTDGEDGRDVFDVACLQRLTAISRLRSNLGVNLHGVAVILDLVDRLGALQRELTWLRQRT